MSSPTSIKHWAEDDQPREKLYTKGPSALSDAELIAILIGSGTPQLSAVEVARQVLHTAQNNLIKLGQLSLKDLQTVKGIGMAKAISIVAALELGKRRNASAVLEQRLITKSADVFQLMHGHVGDLPHEEFWVLYLRQNNSVITSKPISTGGVAGTVVDLKLIFKEALQCLATSLILCHNHPSGNLQPSQADLEITQKIKDAGALLDIKTLDHLIIANNTYFSLNDHGLL